MPRLWAVTEQGDKESRIKWICRCPLLMVKSITGLFQVWKSFYLLHVWETLTYLKWMDEKHKRYEAKQVLCFNLWIGESSIYFANQFAMVHWYLFHMNEPLFFNQLCKIVQTMISFFNINRFGCQKKSRFDSCLLFFFCSVYFMSYLTQTLIIRPKSVNREKKTRCLTSTNTPFRSILLLYSN